MTYLLKLAIRSIKTQRLLTTLVVVTLGLGVGASMVMLSIASALIGNPVPTRKGVLFYPQIDPRPMGGYFKGVSLPDQFTYIDAMNVVNAKRADRQAAMTGGQVTVSSHQQLDADKNTFPARYTTRDFFSMFDLKFIEGSAWSELDDKNGARVVVVTSNFANRVLHTNSVLGKTITLNNLLFQIIGVVNDWHPVPHFYDLYQDGAYSKGEDVFLPLKTAHDLDLPTQGSMACWSYTPSAEIDEANCTWIQVWVQLNNEMERRSFVDYLRNYSLEQKSLGRFQRPPDVLLSNVRQWLHNQDVFPKSIQMETWLAISFLIICLVNCMTMMTVAYLRKATTLSIRRALGATRLTIYLQLLTESAVYGAFGGIVAIAVMVIGVHFARMQETSFSYLINYTGGWFIFTFVVTVCATLIAAIIPSWQVARRAPYDLLKYNG